MRTIRRATKRTRWIVTAIFAAGAIALFFASTRANVRAVGIVALVFDACVIGAYATLYSYEYGSPTRWAFIFVVVEGALRFGLVGAVALCVALFPFLAFNEWWRAHHFGGPEFKWDRVTFPFGVFLTTGAIVGWLVNRLGREAAIAEDRAAEAVALRDELGRRVDLLEAANRCARALGSSLDADEAFAAFIRELRGLVEFDRSRSCSSKEGRAEVMAVAGRGTDTVFPPGSARPVKGSVLEEVLDGKLVYRPTLEPPQYPEEEHLLSIGLHSRVLAPLQVGPRTIGMLGLVRAERDAFSPEDRARRAARASRRHRCAEHSRLRGGTKHGGRVAAALWRCERISSHLCRTSSAARWRLSSVPHRRCKVGGGS